MTKARFPLLGLLIALTFIVGSIQARGDDDVMVGALADEAATCGQSDLPGAFVTQDASNVQAVSWPAASESVGMVPDAGDPVGTATAVTALGASQDLNPSAARLCNGLPYLCERSFDQVTFPGNHNAGSGAGGNLKYNCWGADADQCISRNQGQTITEQLAFGIRYFDIDTCRCDNELVTCHKIGFPYEYAAIGPKISDMLAEFDAFLKRPENRNEVIVLTFGDQDGDKVALQLLLYDQLLRWEPTPDRITNRKLVIYKPPLPGEPPATWPTLGSLVDSNRRIVVFVRDPIASLKEIGVISERDAIFDTYIQRGCTTSCDGVVNDSYNKCREAKEYYPTKLVLVTVNCAKGLCIEWLAKLCQPYLLSSLNTCRDALGGVRVPSFITADWTEKYYVAPTLPIKQNIVEAVRYFNLNHLKESTSLPISNGTASYIGFESNRNGKMISSGANFHTQWISDDELWRWEPVESSDNLEYGQSICLQAKTTEGYLSNMGNGILGQMVDCLGNENWIIEKYSEKEAVGQVQAGDEICLRSKADNRYIRAYDTSLGLQGTCQSDEKWLLYASWKDSDKDFVIDEGDNCPDTPNPDQSDWNNNGIGDVCDAYPFGTFLPAILRP